MQAIQSEWLIGEATGFLAVRQGACGWWAVAKGVLFFFVQSIQNYSIYFFVTVKNFFQVPNLSVQSKACFSSKPSRRRKKQHKILCVIARYRQKLCVTKYLACSKNTRTFLLWTPWRREKENNEFRLTSRVFAKIITSFEGRRAELPSNIMAKTSYFFDRLGYAMRGEKVGPRQTKLSDKEENLSYGLSKYNL